jgi:glycosyltransferase involved in cell wall biosynthesis
METILKNLSKLPVRVALVLAHLPHYRYGLFTQIEEHAESVAFISGDNSKAGNIASIPPGTFKIERTVRNKWFGPLLWQRGVASALRKSDPKVVIFTGDPKYLSTWVNALIARARGQKVLFWTIGWHKPDQGLRRFVRLAFYYLAHELLIYGDHGSKLGVTAGYPASRINVVYNSCESLTNSDVESLSPESLPDGSRPVVGAVIRLSHGKGLEEVIKSVAYLKEHHGIEADCLIVGEGPARKELETLAAELNVRLFLPGALYSQRGLTEVYQKLTVTVVPKAAGLTVLQSMSEGTPVVTISDPYQQMPEFEAIIDGVTGSLIKEASGPFIAAACAEWIGRIADSPKQIYQDCITEIQHKWTPKAQTKRILEVVQRLADN